jgi:hypothetical protein
MFTVDRQTSTVVKQQQQQHRPTMTASAVASNGPRTYPASTNSRNVSIANVNRYEKAQAHATSSEPTPMTTPIRPLPKIPILMTKRTTQPTITTTPNITTANPPTQQINMTTPQPHKQIRQSMICEPVPEPETITKLLMEQQVSTDRIRSELDMLWEALQTLTNYQYPHTTATNNTDRTNLHSPPSLQHVLQQQSTKPPQPIPTIRNPVVHDPTTFGFHRPHVPPKLTPLRPAIAPSSPNFSPTKQNRTLRFRAHTEWFIYNPANTDFDRHAYIHQSIRRRPRLSGPRWRAHMISIIKQERRQQAQQVRSLQPSSTIRQRLPHPHTKQEKAHQRQLKQQLKHQSLTEQAHLEATRHQQILELEYQKLEAQRALHRQSLQSQAEEAQRQLASARLRKRLKATLASAPAPPSQPQHVQIPPIESTLPNKPPLLHTPPPTMSFVTSPLPTRPSVIVPPRHHSRCIPQHRKVPRKKPHPSIAVQSVLLALSSQNDHSHTSPSCKHLSSQHPLSSGATSSCFHPSSLRPTSSWHHSWLSPPHRKTLRQQPFF